MDGLNQKEAEKRLKQFGLNEIRKKKRVSDLRILLSQFQSPLIYVLVVAMAITGGVLHDIEDTIVIGLAVLFNTVLGYFQERKANRSLEALAAVLSPKTKVKRDGQWQEIEAKKVVPGDVCRLELGSKVPADGHVIQANSLATDEAVLTGESGVVDKQKTDKVFMGTTVAGGIGEMVVETTGEQTEFGKIAVSLEETKEEATPLQKQIEKFAKIMAVFVLLISLIVMAVGLATKMSLREIFPTAVALAVAAIPEGLAVSLTVILAIGMQRILKQKALVRKMVAAETLGGVSVICADKTGTLTEGKMRVVEALTNQHELLVKAAILCNDMRDPLEIAMMDWAKTHLGGSPFDSTQGKPATSEVLKLHPRLDSIPFDPKWRYIATLHRQEAIQGKPSQLLLVSGAPEEVLKKCSMTNFQFSKWLKKFETEAKKGHRLVGFSYKETNCLKIDNSKIENLQWLGALVYEDPLRPGVREVLETAQKAGIKVKVISGDYRHTAEAVAKKLGLLQQTDGEVMEGWELEKLSEQELSEKIVKTVVFARTKPEQKLRIVEALQKNGEVVAMTGDGVNDAPALKKADIGIVVSEASDVSKETADMVLLDNNFSTILHAVEGGRVIRANLKKVILYLLADSFGEIVIVLLSLIARVPLAITAGMILWINLVSDGFPHLALTVEPAEKDLLKRPPAKKSSWLIDSQTAWLIALISLASALTAFGAFWYYWHNPYYGLAHARSVAFSLLGLNSLVYVWSARSLSQPLWRVKWNQNLWLIGAVAAGLMLQLVGLYSALGQRLLDTVGIDWSEWLVVGLGSLLMLVIVEGVKWTYNRKMQL